MNDLDESERQELLEAIHNKPNFVALRRYGNDIRRLMRRYPNGCPDHIIATGLMIDETDVQEIYDSIVAKMQVLMKVTEE